MQTKNNFEIWVAYLGEIVWGPYMLLLLVGTGFYLTFILRGLQFRKLIPALYLALIKRKEEGVEGDISHFQALMTAMAATIGTGNIAGVATAIHLGGPGALFWMWITGLVGMATKYSEALLAVKFREKNRKGKMSGGPMHYLSKGVGSKFLAGAFSFFTAIAAFGIGNAVQSNSIAQVLEVNFSIAPLLTSGILAVLTACVILGGIKWIGIITGFFVPFMVVFYFLGALFLFIAHLSDVPLVLYQIFDGAFSGTAATGGFMGAMVSQTVRFGVARGVFSNESGLGSSPIAAAAAQTKSPVTQALVSMTQTFIDTLVVCSLTGFAILLTGVWEGGKTGAALTSEAFTVGLPGSYGGVLVAFSLVLFAYSTVLGWSYYGQKGVEFLLGEKMVFPYRILFCAIVFVGGVADLNLVWNISDIFNGLMAVPNLIGLLLLSKVVVAETSSHFDKVKA